MFSLVIDGNFLLNKMVRLLKATRTLYNPADPFMIPKGYEWMETELELSMLRLVQKMQKFAVWSHTFIVCDTRGNWRKKKYPEYKGKRKKDESVDWSFVFAAYDRWKQGMKDQGHPIYWLDGLEGDDWITFACRELNNKGFSVAIATGDKDMKQLVKTGWADKKEFINIQWKEFLSRYQFILPQDHDAWLKNLEDKKGVTDIFDMDSDSIQITETLSTIVSSYEFETVEWREFLFKKLLEGDTSDNITSALTKPQNRKDGSIRQVGIGPGTSAKIWNDFVAMYGDEPDLDSEQWMEDVRHIVLERMKVKEHEEEFKKRRFDHDIRRNRDLMQLDVGLLPQYYIDELKKLNLIKDAEKSEHLKGDPTFNFDEKESVDVFDF